MSNNPTMVVEAFACDEYGDGPAWAEVVVDQKFLDKLQQLSGLCKEHGLEQVRVNWAPERWDNEDDLRLRGNSLVVTEGDFWFTAYPKHANYDVETRIMCIDDLVKALGGNVEPEGPFRWHEDKLFYAGDPGLIDDLMAASADCDNQMEA